jgi:hypothetical protein
MNTSCSVHGAQPERFCAREHSAGSQKYECSLLRMLELKVSILPSVRISSQQGMYNKSADYNDRMQEPVPTSTNELHWITLSFGPKFQRAEPFLFAGRPQY